MGLILDSSVVIGSERLGNTASTLLRSIALRTADQQIALSSIGLTELVHGAYRSATPAMRMRHERFVDDLLAAMEVIPYTKSTALLAGRIDGEQRALGITIPSMDLLIGATALEFGYSVVTFNTRHFRLIPRPECDRTMSGMADTAQWCENQNQASSPAHGPHARP